MIIDKLNKLLNEATNPSLINQVIDQEMHKIKGMDEATFRRMMTAMYPRAIKDKDIDIEDIIAELKKRGLLKEMTLDKINANSPAVTEPIMYR